MNSNSWWASQPDYFVPEINRLSTHNSSTVDTECGVVENTYEKLNFEYGETVFFRIYYRDLQTGSDTHIVVRNPDNSVLYDYLFTSPWPNYTEAYAEWQYPVDNTWQDGVYTITAEFGGNTYETIFGVNTNLGVADVKPTEIAVYPNPTSNKISIEANAQIEKVEVFDLLGRSALSASPFANKTEINLGNLKTGMYLAIITSEGKMAVKKIVKE